jgi:predicted negative regulator of RcsB-dependent stress response
MRILFFTGWLLIPVVAAAWHYGPGQERMQLDRAAAVLAQADEAAAAKQWKQADELYEEALRLLPPDRVADARRIRLERAKAQMLAEKLPTAHQELKDLVQELTSDPSPDQKLLSEAREALANSQYYVTWLMRLEGAPREDWEPEIEAARQNFGLLAEQAEAKGDSDTARKHEEDLESAIRLARMDLAELQGLPLPSQ